MSHFQELARAQKRIGQTVKTVHFNRNLTKTVATVTVPDVSATRRAHVQCARMENMLTRIEPCSASSVDFLKREAEYTIELLQLYVSQLQVTPQEAE